LTALNKEKIRSKRLCLNETYLFLTAFFSFADYYHNNNGDNNENYFLIFFAK